MQQKTARLERFHDPTACPAPGDPAPDTDVLASEVRDMTPTVADLLGLEFDDFCQCVVLPQGEFARFLKAKSSERQAILLKLLGAGHYEQIGKVAGARAREAEAEAKLYSDQLVGLAHATELALADATQARDRLAGLDDQVTGLVAPVLAARTEQASQQARPPRRPTAATTLAANQGPGRAHRPTRCAGRRPRRARRRRRPRAEQAAADLTEAIAAAGRRPATGRAGSASAALHRARRRSPPTWPPPAGRRREGDRREGRSEGRQGAADACARPGPGREQARGTGTPPPPRSPGSATWWTGCGRSPPRRTSTEVAAEADRAAAAVTAAEQVSRPRRAPPPSRGRVRRAAGPADAAALETDRRRSPAGCGPGTRSRDPAHRAGAEAAARHAGGAHPGRDGPRRRLGGAGGRPGPTTPPPRCARRWSVGHACPVCTQTVTELPPPADTSRSRRPPRVAAGARRRTPPPRSSTGPRPGRRKLRDRTETHHADLTERVTGSPTRSPRRRRRGRAAEQPLTPDGWTLSVDAVDELAAPVTRR